MSVLDAFDIRWRHGDGANGEGPFFRRPLGPLELSFYWDTAFNGVAVLTNHLEFDVDSSCEAALASREYVESSWIRMKQRYPLLGASVEELPGSEVVEFVVKECALRFVRPGELNFLDTFNSVKDVNFFEEQLRNGSTVLDNEFLARVWIGQQKDTPRRYHIFIPTVHFITDGIGNAMVARRLCQELSSLSKDTALKGPPLAVRLESLLPAEALSPVAKLSVVRRRWRLAISKVIQDRRLSRLTVCPYIYLSSCPSEALSSGRSYFAQEAFCTSYRSTTFAHNRFSA